jgi:hypothetical protein
LDKANVGQHQIDSMMVNAQADAQREVVLVPPQT